MAANTNKLELLWMRLEDAKLRLDLVHSHIQGVNQDQMSGAVSSADVNYAYRHGLNAEVTAIKKHFIALQDFRVALALDNASPEEPVLETAIQPPAMTPREREVLALIASGKSSREVAAQLGMAFRTAVSHRYRIYQKLKVHNNVELTRAAMRMGLIEL